MKNIVVIIRKDTKVMNIEKSIDLPFTAFSYETPDGTRYDTTLPAVRDGLKYEELQELIKDVKEWAE